MIESGFYGRFGGYYVSELLMPCLEELERAWLEADADPSFQAELGALLADYAGRPTPLYRSPALSDAVGCTVYLKREDLLHGGAHKTNNTLGQALLAKRMGKTRLIAETGAGQHGVATAMAGALFGMETLIFMGAHDVERQRPNVQRMRLFGAEVRAIEQGSASLKDAINEAMRYWTAEISGHVLCVRHRRWPPPLPHDRARPAARSSATRFVNNINVLKARCPTRSSPASAAAATRLAPLRPSLTTHPCS